MLINSSTLFLQDMWKEFGYRDDLNWFNGEEIQNIGEILSIRHSDSDKFDQALFLYSKNQEDAIAWFEQKAKNQDFLCGDLIVFSLKESQGKVYGLPIRRKK